MRGATFQEPRMTPRRWVSIHAPHARGDKACRSRSAAVKVSIHAPHARGDRTWSRRLPIRGGFNPRPSCEGRPAGPCPARLGASFNPRPSCEGRRRRRATALPTIYPIEAMFQSTPLMRGATAVCPSLRARQHVSIHAPHARGDAFGKRPSSVEVVSIHAPHARGDCAS